MTALLLPHMTVKTF